MEHAALVILSNASSELVSRRFKDLKNANLSSSSSGILAGTWFGCGIYLFKKGVSLISFKICFSTFDLFPFGSDRFY